MVQGVHTDAARSYPNPNPSTPLIAHYQVISGHVRFDRGFLLQLLHLELRELVGCNVLFSVLFSTTQPM